MAVNPRGRESDAANPRRRNAQSKRDACYLTPFEPVYAPMIASWIQSSQELTWLAPGTVPPLTARKVIGWGTNRERRFLLWNGSQGQPIGYAELNDMPGVKSQLWIGHFLIDPSYRRQGYAGVFAQSLVGMAFEELSATEVVLVVFPENQRAIRSYERSGFEAAGEERKYFKTTCQEHAFLRMNIRLSRYRKLVAAKQLPESPLPLR